MDPDSKAPPVDQQAGSTGLERIDADEAVRRLERLYGLAADAEAVVLDVREVSGLYRATLEVRGRKTVTQTAWMTLDGRFVADQLVDMERREDELERDRQFVDCLRKKEIKVFVDPTSDLTRKQLDLLGAFAHRLVVDCSVGPTNCKDLGITELPAIGWGDRFGTGLRTREWLESFTGCK